jgi:hypothetical protein
MLNSQGYDVTYILLVGNAQQVAIEGTLGVQVHSIKLH